MNEWLNPRCIMILATTVIEMKSNDTLNKFNLIADFIFCTFIKSTFIASP